MSHMSVLGACWVQAYFEKKGYFECKHIFGEKVYFGKDLILERRPNFRTKSMERKQHEKRRKSSMQRRKTM
jgi:hypothetical protein